MIVHNGIEFHNVVSLQDISEKPGWRMQRLPDDVRQELNPVACEGALCPTSCELRLVCDGEVTITLYSDVHHEYVQILQGDWIQEEIIFEPGQTRAIVLKHTSPLTELSPQLLSATSFAPTVWRLKFSGTGRIHFLDIESQAPWRAPLATEKPRPRWIAYGSSITQGFSEPRLAMPYILHAARLLGVDVLNLGFGGSCHVEKALADHFAARDDWDVITLELGINLIDHSMTITEFTARVRYMIQALAKSRPQQPVVLITCFPVHYDWQPQSHPGRQRVDAFRQVLRDVRDEGSHPHLHLIEGGDILTSPKGLSTDLCHPSEFGHALMGHNLAVRLRPLVEAMSNNSDTGRE
jgi:lysophospholipase L1-like esterase